MVLLLCVWALRWAQLSWAGGLGPHYAMRAGQRVVDTEGFHSRIWFCSLLSHERASADGTCRPQNDFSCQQRRLLYSVGTQALLTHGQGVERQGPPVVKSCQCWLVTFKPSSRASWPMMGFKHSYFCAPHPCQLSHWAQSQTQETCCLC